MNWWAKWVIMNWAHILVLFPDLIFGKYLLFWSLFHLEFFLFSLYSCFYNLRFMTFNYNSFHWSRSFMFYNSICLTILILSFYIYGCGLFSCLHLIYYPYIWSLYWRQDLSWLFNCRSFNSDWLCFRKYYSFGLDLEFWSDLWLWKRKWVWDLLSILAFDIVFLRNSSISLRVSLLNLIISFRFCCHNVLILMIDTLRRIASLFISQRWWADSGW